MRLRQALPGNLLVRALDTFQWEHQVSVLDRSFVEPRHPRTVAEHRDAISELLLYKMEFFEGMKMVPSSFSFDIWSCRTSEEAAVGHKILGLCHRIDAWRSIADYNEDTMLWRLPRLALHYKSTKKGADSFWLHTVLLDRWVRAHHGILEHWHQLEVEGVKESQETKAWITVHGWFSKWEVLLGVSG